MKNKKLLSLIFLVGFAVISNSNILDAAKEVKYNPRTQQLTVVEKKVFIGEWTIFLLTCFFTGTFARKLYEKIK